MVLFSDFGSEVMSLFSPVDRSEERYRLRRWLFLFLLINGVLLSVVALRFLQAVQIPEQGLAKLFLATSLLGHFPFLALLLYPMIVLITFVTPQRRIIMSLAVGLIVLLWLTLVVDTFIFNQFRFHMNGMVWNLLWGGAALEMLPFSWLMWLLAAGFVVALVVLQVWLARLVWRLCAGPTRIPGLRLVALGVLTALVTANLLHAWADANRYTPITKQVRFFPAFKPLTMSRFLVRIGLAEAGQTVSVTIPDTNSDLNYPLSPLACQRPEHQLNVLWIVIDSWRFDMLAPDVTPHIWNFAQEQWRFNNHYSSGMATRFGIFGLFYGIHSSYWHAMLGEEKGPVLIDELKRQNYRFGIYGSAPLTSPEFDRTVFRALQGQIDLSMPGKKVYERDQEITRRFLDFLDRPEKQPFFGFLFYDTPHGYEYPADYPKTFTPELKTVNHLALNKDYDPVPYRNRFKNATHYTDSLVHKVLEEVQAKGLLDNTVVVITGDHGEEFNETGLNYWGHNGNFGRFQTQVPMVIHWPGAKAKEYAHLSSHVDLAPTLMRNLLGCIEPVDLYSNGRLLTDTSERPFVVSGGWDRYGVIERQRITVTYDAGDVDIVDSDYRPLSQAQMNQGMMLDVMGQMGRFYGR